MDDYIARKRVTLRLSAVIFFHCLDKRINFELGYYKLKVRLL